MTATNTKEIKTEGKTFKGVVVSTKMKDTVVVSVERYEKHPRYQKYIRYRKRFQAHDEGNTCVVGENVTILETKPISKMKKYIVLKK